MHIPENVRLDGVRADSIVSITAWETDEPVEDDEDSEDDGW